MNKIPNIFMSSSRRSRSFTGKERLWQDDLDRLLDMIQEHVQDLENHADEARGQDLVSAPNLSLALFGPAGSGKSSFLKTLVNEAGKKNNRDDRLQKVATLEILQPARFGEGDHLLYATIAAGLNASREKRGEDLDYEVLTPVLKAYRDLSGDLRVLREEPPFAELEPHALAAEVIQRHTSGLSLSKRIDRFLNKLADELNDDRGRNGYRTSVVLLPVDDLDLAPRHLYSGLRELQAYLLHPRLVPVFCFTDRLAEEILTGEYAKIVAHADAGRKQTGRLHVSQQLAVQYLSKCFPIRNRLRLGPIPATLQSGNLQRSKNEDNKEPVLWTLISASTLLFGVPDRSARHPVRSALRPSTLRRQFHVIDAMQQVKVDSLVSEQVISLLKPGVGSWDEPHERVPAAGWGVLFDRAAWALMNVHRDVLREYGMHLEDLYSWTPHGLRRVLLENLLQQPGMAQAGLWQRWRSLADSRRSQIISLLAANAFRPWLDGERPSGEDLPQIVLARAREESGHTAARWCLCTAACLRDKDKDKKIEGRCTKRNQKLAAPVALQWFLDLALGFYLPLGRSVYRYLRAGNPTEKEPLSGAGWSFNTAPVLAAQAAHDDQKLFPAGMMFLDPFSYATALTTAPRIAACQVLDDAVVSDDQWDFVKQVKIFFLSVHTKGMVKYAREKAKNSDTVKSSAGDADSNAEIAAQWERLERASTSIEPEKLEKAWRVFWSTAEWEAGRTLDPDKEMERRNGSLPKPPDTDLYSHLESKKRETTRKGTKKAAVDLESALLKHDYKRARTLLEQVEPGDHEQDFRKHISGLEVAANAVHDDQLLLRIWTCYGYNRGRFWAAVSLWRGLGLIGYLIEAHRRWREEYVGRPHDHTANGPADAKRQELYDSLEYKSWMIDKIVGELHTHSLRGLVPGKDLGEPTFKGTLELAFSGWNTRGQRDAVRRLGERLQSWLDHNWTLDLSPAQAGRVPRWSSCFVRRLHGGYFVGSLWQWLDAEFLEHQGKQYGQRRSYYWNAGVALTSWLRVLQRYFGGSQKIRWLLETCPIAGPFLSRSPSDPFLAKLREKPYRRMLWSVMQDRMQAETTEDEPWLMRKASRFRAITKQLQELWQTKSGRERILDLCGSPTDEGRELRTAFEAVLQNMREECDPRQQSVDAWRTLMLSILQAESTIDWPSVLVLEESTWLQISDVVKTGQAAIDFEDSNGFQSLVEQLNKLLAAESRKTSGLRTAIDALRQISAQESDATGLSREAWNAVANQILRKLSRGDTRYWERLFSPDSCNLGRIVKVAEHIKNVVAAPDGKYNDDTYRSYREDDRTFDDRYREDLLSSYRPRVRRRASREQEGGNEDRDTIDSTSACFEIASLIQQHWKVTAHASAASLFYQIPRVRRFDFFDHEGGLNIELSGKSGGPAVEVKLSTAKEGDGSPAIEQPIVEAGETTSNTEDAVGGGAGSGRDETYEA